MSQGNTIRDLLRQAVAVMREEGLVQFSRLLITFAGILSRWLVRGGTYYLYEHSLVWRDRSRYLPQLDSWDLRIIHSNEEADAVAGEGFEDFRKQFVFARRNLDCGAVAFCVYCGVDLAHLGWLAVDATGKKAIDALPYAVSFNAGQACTGGTYTMADYRGKGLMPYGYFERFEYLRARGYTSSRNAVEVSNAPSQKAHAKFDPLIYGVGHFRKILWWQRLRVEELPGGPCQGFPPSLRRDDN